MAQALTPAEIERLQERCRALETFIVVHLRLCNEASNRRQLARDLVDAIDPRMTEEEMQAAWSMIRYHKRIEAEAVQAAAAVERPSVPLASHQPNEGRHG